MGKFLDTTYVGTINAITESLKGRLDNPFYTFTDKPPMLVEYYNINTSHTTLDEATALAYSYTDGDSPMRYNRIIDALLFGMEGIEVRLSAGDFGVESEAIEGTAYAIPNAFTPYPQDYFIIKHTNQDYIFKVTDVTLDTLPTGANMYKIEYKLSSHDASKSDIDELVVETFIMDTANIGTNLSMIIKDDDWNYIHEIESITDDLKLYYRSLFYSDRCQTYIFTFDGINFYDPYMVEFISKNGLMDSRKLPYLYAGHQLAVAPTFPLEYCDTLFHSIERRNINLINNPDLHGMLITDPTSMLSQHLEDYYRVFHQYKMGAYNKITAFDDDTVDRIVNNTRYETDDMYYFKNIIIDYYNYDKNTKNNRYDRFLIESFKEMNYTIGASILFYYIPVAIYIFEAQIKELMKNISR